MSVLWSLSLRAKSADETAKINEYAKELNQKYNFELYTEEYGGLEFFDWGFRYEDIDSDKVKPAKEMIKEVVAHFPDMKLTFRWTGDGSSIQWETISKNGVLVDVEPWQVWIHCEKESFGELLANIPFIKQRGFDVRCNEDEMDLRWEYDHMSEEDLCNDTIVQLSKKMAQTTIYSYKSIMMDNGRQIETFCVMKNGEGEWLVDWALEGLMFCWMVHCWVLERSFSIWDIIKKPEDCFEQLLDNERMSEGTNGDIYKTLSRSVEYEADNSANRGLGHWLALFKSEDKQWLMAADRMLYDCIVLAGMHHNWNTDSSDTPLFEYNEQDELRLFESVSANWWRWPNLDEQKVYVNLLKFTNLDYKSILRNYLEIIKPHRKETAEDLQWLLQEIGDN
jgi:hypothetical protein